MKVNIRIGSILDSEIINLLCEETILNFSSSESDEFCRQCGSSKEIIYSEETNYYIRQCPNCIPVNEIPIGESIHFSRQ